MRSYSNRSNCLRAAKAQLGATAKIDVQFKILKSDAGFSFEPIETAKRVRRKGDGTISHQPSSVRALALMQREGGVSAAEAAAELKQEHHSFRGHVSRLKRENHIRTERVDGALRYFWDGRTRRAAPAQAKTEAPVATQEALEAAAAVAA